MSAGECGGVGGEGEGYKPEELNHKLSASRPTQP